ncbi:Histone-lysine n-methyltransferase, h3 lysine-9 specific suvh5 [Heracleum sosnowskyi]|uniref:Histone-lysine n-methyltransferase, h3 lysine-9 specific suvh5 n=1 Tax=Heracleum sosnowskyi TaxID=360622 RepID=A0AAD8IPA5_9APIA|nr:Histone-lysine n-methyltransferase, h3 lysine-9 specific suvh5 [Heracleum sosnowskyi]
MRTFLSGNCSGVRKERSLERGSCEGLGISSSSKRLTVDHDHQHNNPQMKKMKLGSERRAISPIKFPGQLAPTNSKRRLTERLVFHGKEAVNRTEKRPRRKIEMRPPRPIRDAVFIRMGPDSSPREMQLNCQNKQVSSFESCKDSQPSQIRREISVSKQTPGRLDPVSSSGCQVFRSGKYDADRRPLVEIICANDEGTKMGLKADEGALEVSGNDLRSEVRLGIAESRNLKVTRFDRFKPVTPASKERMVEDPETGIVYTSQSNMERPKFRCQPAGFSSVQVAVKHKALSPTPYDSEGRKNEISSADKSDYLGFEVDKAKASQQNYARRKSSTCSGKVGMVGLSSGIHNSSYAFRDENDASNLPHNNQENRCESKVLKLNSAPYNNHQVSLYCDEVREVLGLYKDTVERLRHDEKINLKGKGKKGMQIYVDAAMQLKEQNKWLNMQKCIGAVPGVEVGAKFHRRAELVIIGLHSKFLAGIDFKKMDGTLCATSIVASGRYGDKTDSSDVLIYVGEGGSSEKLEDQKLVRGNLALKNSVDKAPVRVIRSIQNVTAPNSMHANTMDKLKYYYDGLYFVRKWWPEREHRGNLVFKFQLERIQGQKDVTRWNTQNTSRKSNKASHGSVVVHDISEGTENMPIRAVNAIDCEKPPPFKYTTKMMYCPQQCVVSKPRVCDCLNGCTENIACSCIRKNNCEVSVNDSVSVVFECGLNCKCPPDCKNRLTQHGIKLQLEVFKTLPNGWGVRSRNFISKGRFICEYVGELLQYNQEEGRVDFDKSTIDPGKCSDGENLKFGNVGRFIRHSCSPNLYAKCVLFDHGDKGRPHVMLFAAKNIPPGKELTFDYKLW